MKRIAALALLAAAPASLHAQPADAPAPPPVQADSADDPETEDPDIIVEGEAPKKICEIRRETGSIMPRRVCRTPEQVAQEEERARTIKDNITRDRDTAQFTEASRGNR